MRYLIAAALAAQLPAASPAQQADHHARHHAAAGDSTHMRTPCPLHLTTLDLTPAQDSALRAIRAAHVAEVRAVRARLGVAADAKTETKENARMAELANAAADEEDAGRRGALLRKREEARLRAHAAKVEKERKAAELAAQREAERQRKEQEAKALKKLRELGVCDAGFRWIQVGSNYHSAGGYHVVPVSSLGL